MGSPSDNRQRNGVHYFTLGCKLIREPGIKRYVILPLLFNIILMGGAFWWLFNRLGHWIPAIMSYVPQWLQWLDYLIWPLSVISVLLVFGYLFSTLANWIAAPFCGLLAEQLEARLTGAVPPDTGVLDVLKDTPRIMQREWQKFCWYLPRALLLFVLYFIPGIGQTVAPVLWFLFSAWMLALQYCDYPFDNHKVPFGTMRQALRTNKVTQLQFGSLVNICTLIPVVNLFIMPVAVCGATAMWVDCYRDQHGQWK